MSSSRQQLEDVPELMQLIQLRLPVKEAARTSVLSKSWLHAWSTISTLRFSFRKKGHNRRNMMLVDLDRTLKRYRHDNIPIERFHLDIDFENHESPNLVKKCIRTIATINNSTLKELSLSYDAGYCKWFSDLLLELLSCENLTKLTVTNECWSESTSGWMISHYHHVIIKCVSLQELCLHQVNISQELLEAILSSCKLLVKIELIQIFQGLGLNTIKVTNLPCLYHLRINTRCTKAITLEIYHVPNLRVFTREQSPQVPFDAHSISLGSSLTELWLGNMVTYDASLDMTKFGAPYLESLTLDMTNWQLGSFHFTCGSIKRLYLLCFWNNKLTDVKVYASTILFFRLECRDIMPSLLFPASTLIQQTTFQLTLVSPVDVSYFLKMREALAISSNCELYLTAYDFGDLSSNIDIDDLRTRLPLPHPMNVKRLSFQMWSAKCVRERSSFIDALFEICHPNHVTAMQDYFSATKNYFCKVMLTEVLEKKTTTPAYWVHHLKHVQISCHKKCETLTDSHKSILESPTSDQVDFKLEWQ